jgi:hypothetical protein
MHVRVMPPYQRWKHTRRHGARTCIADGTWWFQIKHAELASDRARHPPSRARSYVCVLFGCERAFKSPDAPRNTWATYVRVSRYKTNKLIMRCEAKRHGVNFTGSLAGIRARFVPKTAGHLFPACDPFFSSLLLTNRSHDQLLVITINQLISRSSFFF